MHDHDSVSVVQQSPETIGGNHPGQDRRQAAVAVLQVCPATESGQAAIREPSAFSRRGRRPRGRISRNRARNPDLQTLSPKVAALTEPTEPTVPCTAETPGPAATTVQVHSPRRL